MKRIIQHILRPPGCIATGKTLDEVKQRMREALELHLRGGKTDYQSPSPAWLSMSNPA